MEINKKNRTELKSYFLANKIPTQKHFEEFVEANLNQAEDGIAKVQGSPIALQAEGDSAGTQEVLNLFASFKDDNPCWSINLNPRVDAAVPGSNKPGLNIKDASEESKLFIQAATGNVGIGTIEPSSRLSIQAREADSLISVESEVNGEAKIFEVSQELSSGVLSVRSGDGTTISQLSGQEAAPSFFMSKVGVGTDDPKTDLHVMGNGAEIRIKNIEQGNSARLALHSSKHRAWQITNDETSGDALTIKATGAGEKGINISRDGKLGALGGVNFGERTSHINQDGSMYRLGGKLFMSIDDNFYIRDIGGTEKFDFNSNNGRLGIGDKSPAAPISISGTGKTDHPDGKMHITDGGILFGGNNGSGKQKHSAKICAGHHEPNSLNIVGMSSGSSNSDRKVDIWAEGGLTVRGHIKTTEAVAFSVYVISNSLTNNRPVMGFGGITTNLGNAYNSTTHTFTAPVKGLYLLTMNMYKLGNDNLEWLLRKNGTGYVNGFGGGEVNEKARLIGRLNAESASRTVLTVLEAGDKITIQQAGKGRVDNYRSGWEGVLLNALPA